MEKIFHAHLHEIFIMRRTLERWNAETYAMPASRRIWPETRGKKMAGLTERTERQKASYKITFVYHRRRHRPDYDVDADVDERTLPKSEDLSD